jgi:purine-binding chemotaxis protein CheW
MSTSAVIFRVGEDHYALAAAAVREVVSEPRLTRLPTAPAVLLGAFNLRGEVIPTFDTAALLGIGTCVHTPIAVVIETTAGPAALIADGLPKFIVLDRLVRPSELRGTIGVYEIDGGVVVLLDAEALLAPAGSAAHLTVGAMSS